MRSDGHDVLALQEHDLYEGLPDAEVLELAIRDARIVVTCNAKHFVPLLVGLADGHRSHSGCILLWRVQHQKHGTILGAVRSLLAIHTAAADWVDRSASA